MRFHPTALLGISMLLLSTLGASPKAATAQPDQITVSTNKLITAFQSVQAADLQGASQADVVKLTNQLNMALQLLQKGQINSSDAQLSADLSSQISNSALVLLSRTQSQIFFAQVWTYSVGIVIALLSTLLLMEAHRVNDFLRKRRFSKSFS